MEITDERFENLVNRYARYGIYQIDAKIEMARDKEFAKQRYLPSYLDYSFDQSSGYLKTVLEDFDFSYKLGYQVEDILLEIHKDVNRKLELLIEFKTKYKLEYEAMTENELNIAERDLYLKNESELKRYSNKVEILRDVIKCYGMLRISQHYKELEEFEKLSVGNFSLNSNHNTILNWTVKGNTGTVDFIKLVYGLYYAGYINNGNGHITKIVEQMAYFFNVKLGKSWPSKLTRNRNERNNDYDRLKVFDSIKDGYTQYLKEFDKKS